MNEGLSGNCKTAGFVQVCRGKVWQIWESVPEVSFHFAPFVGNRALRNCDNKLTSIDYQPIRRDSLCSKEVASVPRECRNGS